MFRKVHLRLTCLCAVITISILCLSAALYLHIAETSLEENHFLSFQHNMDTLCASLEQQSVITFQYLMKLENNGEYFIYLWDNEIPFHFNSIEHHAPYQELAQKIQEQYLPDQGLLADEQQNTSAHQEFCYQDTDKTLFDVCSARIVIGQLSAAQNLTAQNQKRGISILVLSPRTSFLHQIYSQRIYFGILAVAGCILLTFFAWIFTGRLLLPIQENHKKQVQFVSDASHELRTPLAVIRTCISVRPPHFAETIRQECIHMGRLVDDMLTLNSLENTTYSLQKEVLEPDTLLLNVYEQTQLLAMEKKLKLSIELPEEALPRFQADPGRLCQLLLILVQNAISYTPEGGRITLRVFSSKKEISFQVEDTGAGIPEKDKKLIFERFYRSDTAHSDKEHFGLGLCIAREIVHAHNGKITVSDTPGGGSVFTCSFPVTL